VAGRPLVEWSWRSARDVPEFDEVWVATDSPEVAETVRGFGGTAVLTDASHASGTDRVAEAAGLPGARSHPVVVNYQADEPFLPAAHVGRAVRAVTEGGAAVATLACPLRSGEAWRSRAVVKVVRDASGDALYFSRAAVPRPRDGAPDWSRAPGGPAGDDAAAGRARRSDGDDGPGDGWPYLRHVGMYVFRREALERWTSLPPSRLERVERLEQLRALEAGMDVRVVTVPPGPPGVDVPDDLERAERILQDRHPDTGDVADG
jgi:3-deoxy-manno-octulosonate cytidylyltransferase (CMP-KDO synthetase)